MTAKLCINCKHFYNKGAMKFEWCQHPNVGFSPIDGKINPSQASTQRMDFRTSVTCGSEGKWFEPKLLAPPTSEKVMTSSKPIFWQKLKGFFK